MEEQLDIFFQLFLEAIEKVPDEYFYTAYGNIPFQADIERLVGRGSVFMMGDDILRPGERVYAYELYHQLRNLVDEYKNEHRDFLTESILQAEVNKHQYASIMQNMSLGRLSSNFTPDILLHKPGQDSNQDFVIEIKASFNLSDRSIYYDLKKIAEFITEYKYKRGIFLAICQSFDAVKHSIEIALLEKLRSIFSFELAQKVKIVVRQYHDSEIKHKKLSEIIY